MIIQRAELTGKAANRCSDDNTTRMQLIFSLENNDDIYILRIDMPHKGEEKLHINMEECIESGVVASGFPLKFDGEKSLKLRKILDVYKRQELRRRRNKEISFCELPEIVVEKLAVWDEYESDYTAFDVCGIEIRVLDDELADALKALSEKDRNIVLMYFFLGMSDAEIGDKMKIDRSTSFRIRKSSLDKIGKKLKENTENE